MVLEPRGAFKNTFYVINYNVSQRHSRRTQAHHLAYFPGSSLGYFGSHHHFRNRSVHARIFRFPILSRFTKTFTKIKRFDTLSGLRFG
jgi:hypothetical protein